MKNKLYSYILLGCLLTIAGSALASAETHAIDSSKLLSTGSVDSAPQSHLPLIIHGMQTAVPKKSNAEVPQGTSNSSSEPIVQSSSIITPVHDYFDDAVFIGDSRTEGLMTCSDLSNATFYAVKGLTVSTLFTKSAVKTATSEQTIIDALKTNKFGKVYIMLGINELGWTYSDLFIKKYGEVIDAIQQSQPNAKICVQAIFPVTEKRSASDQVFNNKKIRLYNQLILQMTKEKNVRYLDISPALTNSSGSLCVNASSDGIHLNHAYCQKWSDFLRANK